MSPKSGPGSGKTTCMKQRPEARRALGSAPVRRCGETTPSFLFPAIDALDQKWCMRGFGWACSSAGEHCIDIAGVTGSIPVTPTIQSRQLDLDRHPGRLARVGRFRSPQGKLDIGELFERNAPVPALTGIGHSRSDHCGSGSGVFPGLSGVPPLPSRQGSPIPQHLPL